MPRWCEGGGKGVRSVKGVRMSIISYHTMSHGFHHRRNWGGKKGRTLPLCPQGAAAASPPPPQWSPSPPFTNRQLRPWLPSRINKHMQTFSFFFIPFLFSRCFLAFVPVTYSVRNDLICIKN